MFEMMNLEQELDVFYLVKQIQDSRPEFVADLVSPPFSPYCENRTQIISEALYCFVSLRVPQDLENRENKFGWGKVKEKSGNFL